MKVKLNLMDFLLSVNTKMLKKLIVHLNYFIILCFDRLHMILKNLLQYHLTFDIVILQKFIKI